MSLQLYVHPVLLEHRGVPLRIPLAQQWDPAEHDRVLALALAAASAEGVTGKAVTPYLLLKIVELSEGRSLEVNLDLARNNVRIAGEIAKAWSALA